MTWKDTFGAALTEVNPVKLLALIREAELAMTARSESSPTVSNEELLAIGDATCTLRILKEHARSRSRPKDTSESGDPYGHDRDLDSTVR